MALGLNIDTAEADYDDSSLDATRDALALMTTPGDVHAVRHRLHQSLMHRIHVLKPGNPRHISAGPIPLFFRRAIALCDARLAELSAERRQASDGATVAGNQANEVAQHAF